jgi:hypothetical protein
MIYEFNKLHQGLSYEQYAEAPGIRASDLKLVRRSPAHWLAAQSTKDKPSEAKEFGRIFHKAMEAPQKFLDLVIVEPIFIGKTKDGRDSERSAEAKMKKEEWKSSLSPDRIVLSKADADTLTGMLTACLRHKIIGNMFREGVRETSLWVTDDVTGEVIKCRPDFINSRSHVCDIKTTRNASRNFFLREIFSCNYFSDRFYALQAAHYVHCARIAKVCRDDAFIFVAIEKEPPYGIMIHPLDRGGIEVGERARSILTSKLVECRKNNAWPCYPETVTPVEIPQWVQWFEEDS